MSVLIEHGVARGARGWWKVAAMVACAAFISVEVWAAAALAYDPVSGITGHGIDVDKRSAKRAAFDDCESNGGVDPQFWFWYPDGGWGAVAFSDNGGGAWTLGGSLGYSTPKKAKRRAKRECRESGGTNCQIVDLFEDTIGKSGGKKRGTGFFASN